MTAHLVPATGTYLDQILHETFPIWNDGLTLERYARLWEAQLATPWGRTHLDRVALVEQGSVTSSAKRYDLSARIDGRLRRVLGVGAVFTSPARRGRGGARRLLQLVLDAAEAEGYEYAMLFSEIDPGLYEQLGFVPVPLMESTLEVKRGAGAPAVLMRTGDDRDIPAIAEMSLRRAARSRLSLDRSEEWIRHGITKQRLLSGLGPAGGRETEFLVTEEGHQAVAYVVATVHDRRWFIEDIGDRDPSGARAGAMLQAMLARSPHLAAPEIKAWLPHEFSPPQVERTGTRPIAAVFMIRPFKDRTLPLPPLEAHDVIYCRSDYF